MYAFDNVDNYGRPLRADKQSSARRRFNVNIQRPYDAFLLATVLTGYNDWLFQEHRFHATRPGVIAVVQHAFQSHTRTGARDRNMQVDWYDRRGGVDVASTLSIRFQQVRCV